MKLNMGCGFDKREGYVNVDLSSRCNPDVVCNLEELSWPWPDNSVDEVMFSHALEHMGATSAAFLGIMTELYRICKDGARIIITVPHPRHDNFLNDPTHVRVVTPALLTLFDLQMNEEWVKIKAANTKLAMYLGVDFRVSSSQVVLEEPYFSQFNQKKLSEQDLIMLLRERNNIASEYRIEMVARKPEQALKLHKVAERSEEHDPVAV